MAIEQPLHPADGEPGHRLKHYDRPGHARDAAPVGALEQRVHAHDVPRPLKGADVAVILGDAQAGAALQGAERGGGGAMLGPMLAVRGGAGGEVCAAVPPRGPADLHAFAAVVTHGGAGLSTVLHRLGLALVGPQLVPLGRLAFGDGGPVVRGRAHVVGPGGRDALGAASDQETEDQGAVVAHRPGQSMFRTTPEVSGRPVGAPSK